MIRSVCDNIQKEKWINIITSEKGWEHTEGRNSGQ